MRRLLPILLLFSCASLRSHNVERLPANFGEVEAGIFRGAQPSGREFDALAHHGIRTIIKMNGTSSEERRKASELGIRLIDIPLSAHTLGSAKSCPSEDQIVAALADPANHPIYLHCHAGRDRTGYIIGLYREKIDGWSFARVDGELASFGHRGVYRRLFPNITEILSGARERCH